MNDLKIKVSILIPVYNAEKYLRASLDSAINQSLKEIEIICVNDASTDSSAEILAEYRKKDPRIKTIDFSENMGTHIVRKKGVETACGKYIMFLDPDDTLSLNACERAFQMIESHHVDIFHFSCNINVKAKMPKYKSWIIRRFLRPYKGRLEGKNIFLSSFGDHQTHDYTLWNKIMTSSLCKKAYDELPNFRLTVYEDLLAYFVISFMADSYYGEKTQGLYNYNLGIGICGGTYCKVSDRQFYEYCITSKMFHPLKEFLSRQNALREYDPILTRFYFERLNLCSEKFILMHSPEKWKELFCQYWFHGDERLFQYFMIMKKSLSFKLGLFLTWGPRKILSLLTGRQF